MGRTSFGPPARTNGMGSTPASPTPSHSERRSITVTTLAASAINFPMVLDYRKQTLEERVERLESRQRMTAATMWFAVVIFLIGIIFFTVSLWALGRAGVF